MGTIQICAGIAALLLLILRQSGVPHGVKTAAKICAPAKIAVFSFPARAAIAVNRARRGRRTKNGLIFATGFRWTKNSAPKQQDSKKSERTPKVQKPRLTAYSSKLWITDLYFLSIPALADSPIAWIFSRKILRRRFATLRTKKTSHTDRAEKKSCHLF